MSISQDQLFDSVLSLPQQQRADLAFQLLQSLDLPGDKISSEDFGAELHARIQAQRRGEMQSFSLGEARAIMQQRIAKSQKP